MMAQRFALTVTLNFLPLNRIRGLSDKCLVSILTIIDNAPRMYWETDHKRGGVYANTA